MSECECVSERECVSECECVSERECVSECECVCNLFIYLFCVIMWDLYNFDHLGIYFRVCVCDLFI